MQEFSISSLIFFPCIKLALAGPGRGHERTMAFFVLKELSQDFVIGAQSTLVQMP